MNNASHRFNNLTRYRDGNHGRQRMLTPEYVLRQIQTILGGIDLDPCTEPNNPTQARLYFSPPQDGLLETWEDASNVFCNPPYGKARNKWVEKCVDFGKNKPCVLLIPSSTETQIVQYGLRNCESVCFVQARLRFSAVRKNGRKEAASHGSMIIGFNIDLSPLSNLGVVFGRPIAISANLLSRVDVGC